MNLFDLFAKISLDTKDYEKGIEKSKSALKTFSAAFGGAIKTTANLTKEITAVGNTAAKVFAGLVTTASGGIAAMGKVGIEYNSQIESYVTNFTTMLGDAEKAAVKVEEIKDMAAKTPFGLADLADATQTLLAFGIENEKTTEIMQQLGDISLGNAERFQSLTLAFSQATSAGKLAGQDLLQMINAGFNPLSQLVDKTGLSVGQLKELMGGLSKSATKAMLKTEGLTDYGKKLIEQGYISAEDLAYALDVATREGGQFFNGMEAASKTVRGLLSTLQDDATALTGQIFEPASEALKNKLLPRALEYVATLSEAYGKNGLEGLIDGASEIFGDIVLEATKQAPKLVRTSTDTVKQVISAVKKRKNDIRKAAITLFSELTGAFTETVEETLPLIEEFVPDIAEGLLEYGGLMLETGGKIIMSVVNGLSSKSGELSSKMVSVVENGLSFVDLNAEDLATGALNIGTALVTAIGENLPDFTKTGFSILSSLGSAIVNNADEIGEGLDAILNGTLDSIEENVTSENVHAFIKAGTSIVESLLDAIWTEDNKSRIAEVAGNVAIEFASGVVKSLPDLWELVKMAYDKFEIGHQFTEDAIEFGMDAFGLAEGEGLRNVLDFLVDPNGYIKSQRETEADETAYIVETPNDSRTSAGRGNTTTSGDVININVYGVNDPLTLAEQTAIEIERMKERRSAAGG